MIDKGKYDGYMGTRDYGEQSIIERLLCFLLGLFLFGILWVMFKPVDLWRKAWKR